MTGDTAEQKIDATVSEQALVAAMAHALNFHVEDQLQQINEKLDHIAQLLEQLPRNRGPEVRVQPR